MRRPKLCWPPRPPAHGRGGPIGPEPNTKQKQQAAGGHSGTIVGARHLDAMSRLQGHTKSPWLCYRASVHTLLKVLDVSSCNLEETSSGFGEIIYRAVCLLFDAHFF